MGIRSHVGVAIKHRMLKRLSQETITFLHNDACKIHETNEGKLFEFFEIKWHHTTYPELIKLYDEVRAGPDEDFYIVQACHDYPESTDGDDGDWVDNPWNLYRVVDTYVNIDT